MQLKIGALVQFNIRDDSDLAVSLQVDGEDIYSEDLTFEKIMEINLRGLSKAEKRMERNRIAQRFREFAEKLESENALRSKK